jgi:heme exporter protein B
MRAFLAIISRDLILTWRQGGGAGTALGFVLTVIALVPLAIGPDQNLLQRLAPGILWITLLLSVLLTSDRIFQQDYEDGTLDILAMGGLPLEAVALAKALGHWLTTGLPLAILAPLLGFLLNLHGSGLMPLLYGMLLGSLSLSLIAAMGGAITVGLRRGGLLAALLILPLYVPVLIFGISAATAHAGPSGATSSLLVLVAVALVSLAAQPFAAAAALKSYLR